MRIANWKDYELVDASGGERLERFGDVILIRPDPQIIWSSPRANPLWKQAHARYLRSSSGGGKWENWRETPDIWKICWNELTFRLKPMGFKHTGIFPEQAVNWKFAQDKILAALREKPPNAHGGSSPLQAMPLQAVPLQAMPSEPPVKILNLFGYTGAATLACMSAGAAVTHVDASKGMVQWAKENAQASQLGDRAVRWLVDDCLKFVQREQRRGNKYDGIIMDPPSYGRGPGGEIWKLEDQLFSLVEQCLSILSERPLFFILNSYTTGLSPAVMQYLLGLLLQTRFGGKVSADEIGLKVTESGLTLPCGSTAIWER